MRTRRHRYTVGIVAAVAMVAALGCMALAAQDKYTLHVPNGLAFSEFKGYKDWQTVAVSQAAA